MGFTINKSGVLTKYDGSEKEVIIPDGVKVIGKEAFCNNTEIESVFMPDTVEIIGDRAFDHCGSLKRVDLSNNLTQIGIDAFHGCKLETLILPEGITEIGECAFRWSGLHRISLPFSLKKIGRSAFSECKLQELELPEGLEEIGRDAFKFVDFDEITIPSSVKEVGLGAFPSVKNIRLYDSLKCDASYPGYPGFNEEYRYRITVLSKETGEVKYQIPMYVHVDKGFDEVMSKAWDRSKAEFHFDILDSNFKKIKIPEIKREIAEYRINDPINLSPESEKMYLAYLKRTAPKDDKANSSKDFLIENKTLVKYEGKGVSPIVVIPAGIKKIGAEAFYEYNETITDIIIPEGVEIIEKNPWHGAIAFAGCINLKKISIPDTILDIPNDTFDPHYCKSLDGAVQVELKPTYNEYDNGLYLGNDNNPYVCLVKVKDKTIDSIDIHDGCKVLLGDIFKGCYRLRAITLPDSVLIIGDGKSEDYYLKKDLCINMPKNYFKTTSKLPSTTTYDLLTTKWGNDISITDLAWIYLFQPIKKTEEFCLKRFSPDLNKAAEELLSVCSESQNKTGITKLVKFAFNNKENISAQTMNEIVDLATKLKVKSDKLRLLPKDSEASPNDKVDDLEKYCLEKYDYAQIDDIINKSGIKVKNAFKKAPVKYKESNEIVSEIVIKCAISLYIDSFKGENPKARIIKEADSIINHFDYASFKTFLKLSSERTMENVKLNNKYSGVEPIDRMLGLIGRYADKSTLKTLTKRYAYRQNNYTGVDRTQKVINYDNYLKAAILLSDLEEAKEFCNENGWIHEYADIRGKKVYELENESNKTEDDKLIDEAVAIYDRIASAIKTMVDNDGTYSVPIVQDAPIMKKIDTTKPLVKTFYEIIRDFYKNNQHLGSYDFHFEPDALYNNWINTDHVEDAHIGISFPIGILVASYMFESKDIEGELVFCRDKWEHRGDYSEPTRIALHVDPDIDKWKVYIQKGYKKYDM